MIKLYAQTAIDAVQSAKKVAVTTFVKHEGLAKSLTDFVDAQTEYTKQALEASLDAATKITTIVSDKKLYEDVFKNAQSQFQTVFTDLKKGK